jgi:hypothetical protein
MFCHEFILVDLRVMENCQKVCDGCDHVFNLAADMGGMGFIQSNHGVIFYNNTMISFNMLEAARIKGIKRCAPGAQRGGSVRGCTGMRARRVPTWRASRRAPRARACARTVALPVAALARPRGTASLSRAAPCLVTTLP